MKRIAAVVLILGVASIAGLLIIGIRHSNESVGRIRCANNLQQLAKSINVFQSFEGVYPNAIVSKPTNALPPEKQLSWYVRIDPYVWARMDPKWIYNREKPWDDPVNAYVVQNSSSNIFNDGRIFKCPSNPNE